MAEPGVPPEGIFTPPVLVQIWESTCVQCGTVTRFAQTPQPSDEMRCVLCGAQLVDWVDVTLVVDKAR